MGNEALTSCLNNGGMRIFPDKLDPNDSSPTIRRQVNLVATIDPPIAGVTVYFKVWDVDDPFDPLNPTMPDVQWIDNDFVGSDNRGAEAVTLPWTASGVTGAEGRATVAFSVSMQPGNNYRAGASVLQDAINQATQPMADARNSFSPDPGERCPKVMGSGCPVQPNGLRRPDGGCTTSYAHRHHPP